MPTSRPLQRSYGLQRGWLNPTNLTFFCRWPRSSGTLKGIGRNPIEPKSRFESFDRLRYQSPRLDRRQLRRRRQRRGRQEVDVCPLLWGQRRRLARCLSPSRQLGQLMSTGYQRKTVNQTAPSSKDSSPECAGKAGARVGRFGGDGEVLLGLRGGHWIVRGRGRRRGWCEAPCRTPK